MSQTLTTIAASTDITRIAATGSKMTDSATLTAIQNDVAARDPDLAIVTFGINDATGGGGTPATAEEFEAAARLNLDALAGRTVLVGGVAWCGWDQGAQVETYNRASQFNDILESLANEYHYGFVDLFDSTTSHDEYLSQPGEPSVFGPGYEGDDFHYGDVGHAALYDLYSEALFGD